MWDKVMSPSYIDFRSWWRWVLSLILALACLRVGGDEFIIVCCLAAFADLAIWKGYPLNEFSGSGGSSSVGWVAMAVVYMVFGYLLLPYMIIFRATVFLSNND